jgi:hypothetical protein
MAAATDDGIADMASHSVAERMVLLHNIGEWLRKRGESHLGAGWPNTEDSY